ncbi:MAG: HEAT repeat domain-containing protein [Pirellulaceae bacterium]|nr:HEAT repeat domain-containing protein [Pirellulaceae bacterium]
MVFLNKRLFALVLTMVGMTGCHQLVMPQKGILTADYLGDSPGQSLVDQVGKSDQSSGDTKENNSTRRLPPSWKPPAFPVDFSVGGSSESEEVAEAEKILTTTRLIELAQGGADTVETSGWYEASEFDAEKQIEEIDRIRVGTDRELSEINYRWQHKNLETVLNKEIGKALQILTDGTKSKKKQVENIAWIGLARLGKKQAIQKLQVIARNEENRQEDRLAALETLAKCGVFLQLGSNESMKILNELEARFSEIKNETGQVQEALALLEAIRYLRDSGDSPFFLDAIQTPHLVVQNRAVEILGASGSIPDSYNENLITLERLAKNSTDGYEKRIAVRLLGYISDPYVVEVLRSLKDSPDLLVQEEVFRALARQETWGEVWSEVQHEKYQVRQAVASSLRFVKSGPWPIPIAQQLAADKNSYVQQAVLEGVINWPIEASGPVYLAMMESKNWKMQQKSADEMGRRWPDVSPLTNQMDSESLEKELLILAKERQIPLESVAQLKAEEGQQKAFAFKVEEIKQKWQAAFGKQRAPNGLVAPRERLTGGEKEDLKKRLWLVKTSPNNDQYREQLEQMANHLPEILDDLDTYEKSWEKSLGYGNFLKTNHLLAYELFFLNETLNDQKLEKIEQEVTARIAKFSILDQYYLINALNFSELTNEEWQLVIGLFNEENNLVKDELLFQALDQEDFQIQRLACKAIAEQDSLSNPKLVWALRELVKESEAPQEKKWFLLALGFSQRDKKEIADEILSLRYSQDKEVQVALAKSAVRLNASYGKEFLQWLLFQDNRLTQIELLDFIKENPQEEWVGTLMVLLEKEDKKVRTLALEALPLCIGESDKKGLVQGEELLVLNSQEKVKIYQRWYQDQESHSKYRLRRHVLLR